LIHLVKVTMVFPTTRSVSSRVPTSVAFMSSKSNRLRTDSASDAARTMPTAHIPTILRAAQSPFLANTAPRARKHWSPSRSYNLTFIGTLLSIRTFIFNSSFQYWTFVHYLSAHLASTFLLFIRSVLFAIQRLIPPTFT